VPGAPPVRPSVVNNQPLTGWHRSVVLAGALLSPYDAAVLHWPPDTRTRPLRSRAEVINWLAAHGMAPGLVDLFIFSPKACLADFPAVDGGPTPLGELPPSQGSEWCSARKYCTREFWVESCCGYPVSRFFDFENEVAFRHKYSAYLSQFRSKEADKLVAQVKELHEARAEEDSRRVQRITELRGMFSPKDPGIFGLCEDFVSIECLNLLQVAASARSPSELLESPHLRQLHEGCLSFRLFTPAFCNRLVAEMRHFERSSATMLRRPRTNDGVIFSRGVLLDEMGLSEGFTDVLCARVIRPLARIAFASSGGPSLDHHVAFGLFQAPGREAATGAALDAPSALMEGRAEVALVVCLSGAASGGDLCLYGPREAPRPDVVKVPLSRIGEALASREAGDAAAADTEESKDPLFDRARGPGAGGIGEACMFGGDELHRLEPLDSSSGERVLLVVWARSAAWRREYRACDDERPIRESSYLYF